MWTECRVHNAKKKETSSAHNYTWAMRTGKCTQKGFKKRDNFGTYDFVYVCMERENVSKFVWGSTTGKQNEKKKHTNKLWKRCHWRSCFPVEQMPSFSPCCTIWIVSDAHAFCNVRFDDIYFCVPNNNNISLLLGHDSQWADYPINRPDFYLCLYHCESSITITRNASRSAHLLLLSLFVSGCVLAVATEQYYNRKYSIKYSSIYLFRWHSMLYD